MLRRLGELIDRRVKVKVRGKGVMTCKPIQYLEEDYESILVEVLEMSDEFVPGQLWELTEEVIEEVSEA